MALGGKKVMKASVGDYLKLCVAFLSDPHQRVRHAALGTAAKLFDAFAEDDSHFCKRQVGYKDRQCVTPLSSSLSWVACVCVCV